CSMGFSPPVRSHSLLGSPAMRASSGDLMYVPLSVITTSWTSLVHAMSPELKSTWHSMPGCELASQVTFAVPFSLPLVTMVLASSWASVNCWRPELFSLCPESGAGELLESRPQAVSAAASAAAESASTVRRTSASFPWSVDHLEGSNAVCPAWSNWEKWLPGRRCLREVLQDAHLVRRRGV